MGQSDFIAVCDFAMPCVFFSQIVMHVGMLSHTDYYLLEKKTSQKSPTVTAYESVHMNIMFIS